MRKPGDERQITGDLPRAFTNASARSAAAADVSRPRISSASGIRLTGLKKWMPSVRSGCGTWPAMSSIGSAEVLDARSVSGRTIPATSEKSFRFALTFSTIASITRSHVSNPAHWVVVETLPNASRASSADSPPRLTPSSKRPWMTSSARSTNSGSTSRTTTSKPRAASHCAMPEPITPAPTIPTRLTGAAFAVPAGNHPSSVRFFAASRRKKALTRFLQTGPAVTWPNAADSTPSAKPTSNLYPCSTTLIAATGAGSWPRVFFRTASRSSPK